MACAGAAGARAGWGRVEGAQRCLISGFQKGDRLCVGLHQVDKLRLDLKARGLRLSSSASQSRGLSQKLVKKRQAETSVQ